MGQVRMTIESSNKRASYSLGLFARTSVMIGGQVKEGGMNLYSYRISCAKDRLDDAPRR